MSARLTAGDLATMLYEYLCETYSPVTLQKAHWCMDKREFDDPEVAFYPDIENQFPSCIRAMEYVLEEGLPVWLIQDSTNYPLEMFTYRKLNLLFDL